LPLELDHFCLKHRLVHAHVYSEWLNLHFLSVFAIGT